MSPDSNHDLLHGAHLAAHMSEISSTTVSVRKMWATAIAAMISAVVLLAVIGLFHKIGAWWSPGPDMVRAGMWQSKNAHLYIDADPDRPIVLFLGREGFLIKEVKHGPAEWHGKAICFNTGVTSGHVTLDGIRNGITVQFNRTSDESQELTFDRVESQADEAGE